MTQRIEGDQFGRPAYLAAFAVSAVVLFAASTGSLWPPRAGSVWPPLDTRPTESPAPPLAHPRVSTRRRDYPRLA